MIITYIYIFVNMYFQNLIIYPIKKGIIWNCVKCLKLVKTKKKT